MRYVLDYLTEAGSAPLNAQGVATLPYTFATAGSHIISASYSGLLSTDASATSITQSVGVTTVPGFSLAAGTYGYIPTVTINDRQASVVIYYTTDGSTPTTSSPVYSAPIQVTQSMTIKAIGAAPGYAVSSIASAAYVITGGAAKPAFSIAGGTYASPQTLSISTATAGAAIYYTTDGSTPTASSTRYTGPFLVAQTETISAIAIAGSNKSAVATETITVTASTVATPVLSPPGGTYNAAPVVTVTDATAGAVLHYTLNGTVPTGSSPVYSAPLTIGEPLTFSVIAVAPGLSTSAVTSATYTLAAAAPVASPTAGTYSETQSVTLTSSSPHATIYYTTNGAQPNTSSAKYSGPITIAGSTTIKAIAAQTGFTASGVVTNSYVITAP